MISTIQKETQDNNDISRKHNISKLFILHSSFWLLLFWESFGAFVNCVFTVFTFAKMAESKSSRRVAQSEDLSNVEFETSEDVEVVPTFDNMGLREELLRGIYAYGNLINSQQKKHYIV